MIDLEVVRRTRAHAVQALVDAFDSAHAALRSEADLRDAWVAGMGTGGWYDPPPLGVAVLANEPPDDDRLSVPSFRPPHAWPREDRFLTRRSLTYVYASPVDASTGIIGDVGAALYAGDLIDVHEHWRTCLQLVRGLTEVPEIGMPFAEVHRRCVSRIYGAGLTNDIASSTDAAGTNIGHTVVSGATAEIVSASRTFVNAYEQTVLQPGMAITLEPRMKRLGLPTVGFHLIVGFDADGTRVVIDELDPLFPAYERYCASL